MRISLDILVRFHEDYHYATYRSESTCKLSTHARPSGIEDLTDEPGPESVRFRRSAGFCAAKVTRD